MNPLIKDKTSALVAILTNQTPQAPNPFIQPSASTFLEICIPRKSDNIFSIPIVKLKHAQCFMELEQR